MPCQNPKCGIVLRGCQAFDDCEMCLSFMSQTANPTTGLLSIFMSDSEFVKSPVKEMLSISSQTLCGDSSLFPMNKCSYFHSGPCRGNTRSSGMLDCFLKYTDINSFELKLKVTWMLVLCNFLSTCLRLSYYLSWLLSGVCAQENIHIWTIFFLWASKRMSSVSLVYLGCYLLILYLIKGGSTSLVAWETEKQASRGR